MENGEINIEKIMDDIRNEIKEKGYTSDILDFEDTVGISSGDDGDGYSEKRFSELVTYMSSSYAVPIAKPVSGSGIARFIKKIIGALTRFTLRPIVEHQSEYNSVSARAVNMLGAHVDEVSDASEKRIAALELELQNAMKEIDRLREKIEELQR